jgi:hypothetical protein
MIFSRCLPAQALVKARDKVDLIDGADGSRAGVSPRWLADSRTCDREPGITRERVKGDPGTGICPGDLSVWLPT